MGKLCLSYIEHFLFITTCFILSIWKLKKVLDLSTEHDPYGNGINLLSDLAKVVHGLFNPACLLGDLLRVSQRPEEPGYLRLQGLLLLPNSKNLLDILRTELTLIPPIDERLEGVRILDILCQNLLKYQMQKIIHLFQIELVEKVISSLGKSSFSLSTKHDMTEQPQTSKLDHLIIRHGTSIPGKLLAHPHRPTFSLFLGVLLEHGVEN